MNKISLNSNKSRFTNLDLQLILKTGNMTEMLLAKELLLIRAMDKIKEDRSENI